MSKSVRNSCYRDDNVKAQELIDHNNGTGRSILNSLAEGVVVADQQGKLLFFNPVAKEILGIGTEDITLIEWQSVYGTYYPDQTTPYPSEKLPLARAIRGEKVCSELIYIQNSERPDGVFIEVSASPIRDHRDALIGGTMIIRDITKIKQAEKVQKQSEERVIAQFKGFPIPTYVWRYTDDDFVLIDYNNAAEAFTRGTVLNFLNDKISKIFNDLPQIRADFLKCYTEKIRVTREMPSYQLKTTHEKKDLIFNYVFVPPDLIMMHTEDVTEQKHTIVTLKKLSSVVEKTADSVIITNNKGVIEYVNPAFEVTTGYSQEEALGKTPRIIQSGKHNHEFYTNLWHTILSGNTYRGTIINKKKNGELYWSEQTITPLTDEEGNITNFVSLLKDITDFKKKQEQEFQLRIARELQQRLYKSKITVPNYDIAGATYSAVETNGDYFDFISMPDGNIGMAVGDVCGHGIGAALVMAQTRAYLHAFAKVESDPGTLLTMLNRELHENLDKEHYVTLILARLNPNKNEMDYANAGHLPAYVLDKSGKISEIMESTGIPLGILYDYQYVTSKSIKLIPEDIIFFLTDGITEAQKDNETEFGVDRALDLIRQYQKESARKIIERLYQDVIAFSENKPQQDDITSIICKVAIRQLNRTDE